MGRKRKFLFLNPEKTIERIHREVEKEKQKPTLQDMQDCCKPSLKKALIHPMAMYVSATQMYVYTRIQKCKIITLTINMVVTETNNMVVSF